MNTSMVANSITNTAKSFDEYYRMNTKIGQVILIFFVLVAVFWIILYTFNPGVVQGPDSAKKWLIKGNDPLAVIASPASADFVVVPDTARCFVGALVLALICVTLLWLFRSCY
jgi:Kef-type K+ transport system membrane component KefB